MVLKGATGMASAAVVDGTGEGPSRLRKVSEGANIGRATYQPWDSGASVGDAQQALVGGKRVFVGQIFQFKRRMCYEGRLKN